MQLGALTTTSIGSTPRPNWLAQTDRSRATFRLTGDALREAQDDATLVTLREQEEIGLDIVTDGEQRREGFIFHMTSTWDGVDLVNQVQKEIYRNRAAPRMVPRITGKIKRRAPATVDDVRFAKAHTKHPVKMALAGPMTVIDSSLNESYKDEAELAMDIAAAINAELLDLQAAGCDMFQLDEPAMTRYHDKVMAYGARCARPLPRRRHRADARASLLRLSRRRGDAASLHLSRTARPPDADKDQRLHRRVRPQRLRSGHPQALPRPPHRLRLHRSGQHAGTERRRGEAPDRQALEYLDPHRVLLAPDCGLMTISRDLARAKAQGDGRGGAGFAAGIVAIEGKGLFETCGLRVAGLAALLLIVGGAHTSLADDVADFYHGRQMTFVIGSSVGGGYDAYGRLLARFLPKHIPGNPTAVPQNVPGAGSRSASNSLYNVVPKDGSVLGVISQSAPLDQAMRQKGIQFDAGRFNWIGNPIVDNQVTIAWTDSGIATMDDLTKVDGVVCGATGANTNPVFFPKIINQLIGSNIQSRERLSRGSGYSAGDGAR